MSKLNNQGEPVDLDFGPWRKSSFSRPNGNDCVEVATSSDAYAVRDSRNPDGPVLVFTRAEWAAFVAGVTNGEF